MLFGAIFALNSCKSKEKEPKTEEKPAETTPAVTEEKKIVYRKPVSTGLEFWLFDDVSNYDFSGYSFHRQDNSRGAEMRVYGRKYVPTERMEHEYNNTIPPKYFVLYEIEDETRYYDENMFITAITITDPDVSIYGFNVNTPIDYIRQTLVKNGYSIRYDTSIPSFNLINDCYVLNEEYASEEKKVRYMTAYKDDIMIQVAPIEEKSGAYLLSHRFFVSSFADELVADDGTPLNVIFIRTRKNLGYRK